MRSFRDLREKKLTPAEMKKREEIAKAMERDNPGMDMGKKMAIATATAKKVAEEFELDEGAKTHFVYQRGVPKTKQVVHRGTEQSSKDWITKNAKHYAHKGKDFDIYKGKYPNVKPSDALNFKHVAEEVELDENALTTPNADDYVVVIQGLGDNNQKIVKVFKGSQLAMAKKYRDEWNTKNANKIKKNKAGKPIPAHMARLYKHPADSTLNGKPDVPKVGNKVSYSAFNNRIIKEEVQLDEVLDTPKAMDSYRNKAKASKEKAANSAVAKMFRSKNKDTRKHPAGELKTMAKRTAGEKMADRNAARKTYKALRRESTLEEVEQIDEISTDMKNRYMNRASQAATAATMAGKYTKGKEKEKFDRIARNRKAGIKKVVGEEKDPNEYDREGEMMKGQLRQICSANEKLMKMVGDDDNLPEWVQNKVTKATDYIRSVRDYLESENDKDSMSEASKSDMLCKECGDQFGKPTNEKCMYDAYDQLGENWVTKEMYEGLDITEISLDMLSKKISNTNLGNTRKAMKTDKVKTDLAKMRARLDKKKAMKPIKAQSEDVMSADKKPEKYIKPDGKAGIRMVRTDKKVVDKDA